MDGLSRESQFGTDFCTYIVLFVEINASWRQLEIAQENSRSYHQTIWIATNFLPKVKPWSVTTAFLGEWRFLGCKFSEQKGMKQDGVRKTMGPLAPKPIFFLRLGRWFTTTSTKDGLQCIITRIWGSLRAKPKGCFLCRRFGGVWFGGGGASDLVIMCMLYTNDCVDNNVVSHEKRHDLKQ